MVNVSLAGIRQQQLCDIAFQAFSFIPLPILTKVAFIFVFIKNIYFGSISGDTTFSFTNPCGIHFLLLGFSQLHASVFT